MPNMFVDAACPACDRIALAQPIPQQQPESRPHAPPSPVVRPELACSFGVLPGFFRVERACRGGELRGR